MGYEQITSGLRLALEREAGRHQLSPGAWPQIERRLHRQGRRRAQIAAVCVAATVAAIMAAPYLWIRLSRDLSGPARMRPAAQLVIVARTRLGGGITDVAFGYGAVWVIGSGAIYRVDPATAQIVARVRTPGTDELNHITAGAGAVWATSEYAGHSGVYRIDPQHNRVTAFIRLPPVPTCITVAYGRVWVSEPAQGPGTLVRIDPRTDRVSGPAIQVGIGPGRIVAGAGALWVNNDNSVSRINPATGAVSSPANITNVTAVASGSLWMTTNDGIQRASPVTGHVTATILVPNAVRLTFWDESAWASSEPPGTITRIDPASNHTVGKPTPAGASPIYIIAGPGGLWVVDFSAGELLHLQLSHPHAQASLVTPPR
jgi:streptogramin lyase